MTDLLRGATDEEIERAKTDPLFITLALRHRVREAMAKLEHLNQSRPADRQIMEPELIGITVNEAQILIDHFSRAAADKQQLAANLAILDEQLGKAHDEIKGLRTLPEGFTVEPQPDCGFEISQAGSRRLDTVYIDSLDPSAALLAHLLEKLHP